MSLFCKLSRRHYWSIPHRSDDNQLVQACYECGAERAVVEVYKEVIDLNFVDPTKAKSANSKQSFIKKLVAVK
jgi:hypothetical protein